MCQSALEALGHMYVHSCYVGVDVAHFVTIYASDGKACWRVLTIDELTEDEATKLAAVIDLLAGKPLSM